MTEDDTFNRLKRIHLDQMTMVWLNSPFTLHGTWTPDHPVPTYIEKVFTDCGWTFMEWREKYYLQQNRVEWKDPSLDYD